MTTSAAETRARARFPAGFLGDLNEGHHGALRYPALDRLTPKILLAHLVALAGLTLAAASSGTVEVSPWPALDHSAAAAILLVGLVAASTPLVLKPHLRSHYSWRVLIAVSLTTFSYLFLLVSGGATAMHFHFFIVLAYVAVWSDWRLGWIVFALAVGHHAFLDLIVPGWLLVHEQASFATIAQGVPLMATASVTSLLCNKHRTAVLALEDTTFRLEDDVQAREQAERDLGESREHLARLNGELERRVAQRTRELADANAEMEAFSYTVSHDLRAPLRGIEFWSRVLEEDCGDDLSPSGREHLSRLRAESRRLTGLVNDILSLSRSSQGDLDHDAVDLTALARDVGAELRREHSDRDVRLLVEENLVSTGDQRLLRVVLENLLSNAWKYTGNVPVARIEVGSVLSRTIECDAAEDEAAEQAFFVRDNGAGFDMGKADRLFTPFQRLHGPHEFEGTGIGLSSVQRIVRRHGGRIWAEGIVGKGATFYFTLACEDDSEEDVEILVRSVEERLSSPPLSARRLRETHVGGVRVRARSSDVSPLERKL